MKQHSIFILFLFLSTLFSCASETTRQETITEDTSTEKIDQTSSIEKNSTPEKEAKTLVVANSEEDAINKVAHDKEIELINTEVMRINKTLANYTKEEQVADWETLACQLIQYKNKDGLILKAEASCGEHSWEMYGIALSENSNKLLYGKYVEKIPNTARPAIREFYSIGSMIPSENAYRLIMDESGNEVGPEGYRTYSILYEAAFDAFFYE